MPALVSKKKQTTDHNVTYLRYVPTTPSAASPGWSLGPATATVASEFDTSLIVGVRLATEAEDAPIREPGKRKQASLFVVVRDPESLIGPRHGGLDKSSLVQLRFFPPSEDQIADLTSPASSSSNSSSIESSLPAASSISDDGIHLGGWLDYTLFAHRERERAGRWRIPREDGGGHWLRLARLSRGTFGTPLGAAFSLPSLSTGRAARTSAVDRAGGRGGGGIPGGGEGTAGTSASRLTGDGDGAIDGTEVGSSAESDKREGGTGKSTEGKEEQESKPRPRHIRGFGETPLPQPRWEDAHFRCVLGATVVKYPSGDQVYVHAERHIVYLENLASTTADARLRNSSLVMIQHLMDTEVLPRLMEFLRATARMARDPSYTHTALSQLNPLDPLTWPSPAVHPPSLSPTASPDPPIPSPVSDIMPTAKHPFTRLSKRKGQIATCADADDTTRDQTGEGKVESKTESPGDDDAIRRSKRHQHTRFEHRPGVALVEKKTAKTRKGLPVTSSKGETGAAAATAPSGAGAEGFVREAPRASLQEWFDILRELQEWHRVWKWYVDAEVLLGLPPRPSPESIGRLRCCLPWIESWVEAIQRVSVRDVVWEDSATVMGLAQFVQFYEPQIRQTVFHWNLEKWFLMWDTAREATAKHVLYLSVC
jgi:hypothetical protein